MSLIEAALRGGTFVLLVLIGALFLRDARRVPAGLFGTCFAWGVACYTIASAPIFVTAPYGWLLPLRLVSMGNSVVLCLFAAAVFDDDFRPSWWHAVAWVTFVAFGFFCFLMNASLANIVIHIFSLSCNVFVVWYVLAGRNVDLVEERRRLRAVLIVAIAFYSAAIVSSEMVFPRGTASETLTLANSAGLLVITAVFAFVQLGVSRDGALISFRVLEPQSLVDTQPRPLAGVVSAERAERDEDARLLAALRRLMEHDRVYREEGLSIGSLAARLGISEHALRRLINQRLGHRNFNAFLNGYRLDEVTAALADPAQGAVPILTIALDAGFQSLGPFNRAFKSRAGMTPSEFRREYLGQNGRLAAE
ncbi:MAG TPA: helix-turn-helix domain-containing protein [Rhizomicrobium sp.]